MTDSERILELISRHRETLKELTDNQRIMAEKIAENRELINKVVEAVVMLQESLITEHLN